MKNALENLLLVCYKIILLIRRNDIFDLTMLRSRSNCVYRYVFTKIGWLTQENIFIF